MAPEQDDADTPAATGPPASPGEAGGSGPHPTAEPGGGDRELVLPVITRWDVLCVAPIMIHNLWSLFGRFISPGLLRDHTVLLELLRGSIPAIITAGANARVGRTPLWLAVAAPIPILMFVDPFIYWAGRRYGHVALDYLAGNQPKWRRRIAFGERFFARWGAWTIVFSYFIPASPVFLLAAGEVGMSFLLFITADLIGTLIWVGLMAGLGYAFSTPALAVADKITQWAWILTGLLFAFVIVTAVRGGGTMRMPASKTPPRP